MLGKKNLFQWVEGLKPPRVGKSRVYCSCLDLIEGKPMKSGKAFLYQDKNKNLNESDEIKLILLHSASADCNCL